MSLSMKLLICNSKLCILSIPIWLINMCMKKFISIIVLAFVLFSCQPLKQEVKPLEITEAQLTEFGLPFTPAAKNFYQNYRTVSGSEAYVAYQQLLETEFGGLEYFWFFQDLNSYCGRPLKYKKNPSDYISTYELESIMREVAGVKKSLQKITEKVIALPYNNFDGNLRGYKTLACIDPTDKLSISKIDKYSKLVDKQKEQVIEASRWARGQDL